jgi:ABC-2 type transport system permease protein
MTKLLPLIEKEVKDLLRDPRIYIGLIVPIIMLPLMGLVMSSVIQTPAQVVGEGLSIAILDYDETESSEGFLQFLTNLGLNLVEVDFESLDKVLEEAKTLGSKALIIIPEEFESNLFVFGKANVEIYSFIESVGISGINVHTIVDGALNAYSQMLSVTLISKLNSEVDPEVIRNPLNITSYSIVKDVVIEVHPQVLFGQLIMGYGIMVPVVLFILAIMVTQIAATATAVENEEKTLETLLTFPLTRYDILLAKLLGSSVIAVIGGIVFTIGFQFYSQGIFSIPGLGNGSASLIDLPPPSTLAFIVLAITLILSILFMTSIGIVIGALSSDVRMASSMLGIVIIPVIIPLILVIYGDLKSLPLAIQILAYALPTSYPMILAKEMVTSAVPIETLFGIPYSAIITLLVVYLTSKMLAPEKLLTLQHKLKIRKTKKTKIKELE